MSLPSWIFAFSAQTGVLRLEQSFRGGRGVRQGLAAWGHESETADGAGDWGALWAPPGSVFEITSAMGQAKPPCVLT